MRINNYDFFGGTLKGIEEKLERIDWSKEDVLVGSLSSKEQWREILIKEKKKERVF